MRSRISLIAAGAIVGLTCVICASILWPSTLETARSRHRRCIPYFLIPQIWICGSRVYLKHPHKRLQYMGRTADLAPMPKPPQRRG